MSLSGRMEGGWKRKIRIAELLQLNKFKQIWDWRRVSDRSQQF